MIMLPADRHGCPVGPGRDNLNFSLWVGFLDREISIVFIFLAAFCTFLAVWSNDEIFGKTMCILHTSRAGSKVIRKINLFYL